MREWFQKFFEQFEAGKAGGGPDRRVALAVLLHEVAKADFAHQELEAQAIREQLARYFGLEADELDHVLHTAGVRADNTVSLHQYVAVLNESLQPEDKRDIIQMLWRVAYADGVLDAQEEHLVRRLADLLFVSHQDFIQTKLQAAERVPTDK